MKITVADSAGFCFGVQRAVDMAFQTAREGTPACTLGELIHNPWIVERLREQGRCGKSLFSWIGYRKKEILFDRDPRCAGETKWNYARLFELALDGIIALSVAPLRWIGAASLATGAAAAARFVCLHVAQGVAHAPPAHTGAIR